MLLERIHERQMEQIENVPVQVEGERVRWSKPFPRRDSIAPGSPPFGANLFTKSVRRDDV